MARPGIAPAGVAAKNHRTAASDIKQGHLLHQFDDIEVAQNQPTAMEYKVLFKDNPKIQPGASIEIVSTWNTKAKTGTWHVYGMTGSGGGANTAKYVVPGKAPARQRKVEISQIKRSARRASKRPTRSARQRSGVKRTGHRPVKSTPRARR